VVVAAVILVLVAVVGFVDGIVLILLSLLLLLLLLEVEMVVAVECNPFVRDVVVETAVLAVEEDDAVEAMVSEGIGATAVTEEDRGS
jgi:ABC-type transport system involved in cytochrome bd biosynthesis fused ATPase/permease subunit